MEFFARPTVKRIYLDGDKVYWVDLKTALSFGERERMAAEMMQVETGGGASPQVQLKAGEIGIALLAAHITDWNLTDHEGQPVKVNKVTISQLTGEVGNLLREEIGKLQEVASNPK